MDDVVCIYLIHLFNTHLAYLLCVSFVYICSGFYFLFVFVFLQKQNVVNHANFYFINKIQFQCRHDTPPLYLYSFELRQRRKQESTCTSSPTLSLSPLFKNIFLLSSNGFSDKSNCKITTCWETERTLKEHKHLERGRERDMHLLVGLSYWWDIFCRYFLQIPNAKKIILNKKNHRYTYTKYRQWKKVL